MPTFTKEKIPMELDRLMKKGNLVYQPNQWFVWASGLKIQTEMLGDNYFTSGECVDALGSDHWLMLVLRKKIKRKCLLSFYQIEKFQIEKFQIEKFPDRKVGSTLYGFAGSTTLPSVLCCAKKE